jgi:hypothetical protein
MKNDIAGKLRDHLNAGIGSECGVVYLLAEIRKILEVDDPTHTRGALWMYCHWALHVDLDSPKTTTDFLERVDLWVCNNVAYLEPRQPWKFLDEVYLFREFVYLQTFREQLGDFLKHYDFPTDLTNDNDRWFTFLASYAGVIENGTLSMKSDKNKKIEAVEEVTFKKGKPLTSEYHVNFTIHWDIALKDGRLLEVEMDAQPNHPLKAQSHFIKVNNRSFVPPYVIDENGNKNARGA